LGALVCMAVFVFELEKVVTASFEDRISLCFVVIERIAREGGPFEIGFAIEFQCDGLFAFTFVFVGSGGLGSKADRDRRSGFVVTDAQAQSTVADPLSINCQSAWQGAQVAAQPEVQALLKGLRVDLGEEIVQGSPTGNLAGLGAFFQWESKPKTLLPGEQSSVALDGCEPATSSKQSQGNEHQQ
jgi:hypothetical protein